MMSTPSEATVGERIRATRKKAGLSQQGLAKAAGIPKSSIECWEQGTRTPNQTTLLRLAAACGVHLEDLLGVGNAPPSGRRLAELESVLARLSPPEGSADPEAWRSYGIVARDALAELFPHLRRLEEACRHAAVALDRVKSALGENP